MGRFKTFVINNYNFVFVMSYLECFDSERTEEIHQKQMKIVKKILEGIFWRRNINP